jgi:hypothetical protein
MLPDFRTACSEFAVTLLGKVDDNNKVLKKIMFSDEAVLVTF